MNQTIRPLSSLPVSWRISRRLSAKCLLLFFFFFPGVLSRVFAVSAAFDWSMPERFGKEPDGITKIHYFNTREEIAPKD